MSWFFSINHFQVMNRDSRYQYDIQNSYVLLYIVLSYSTDLKKFISYRIQKRVRIVGLFNENQCFEALFVEYLKNFKRPEVKPYTFKNETGEAVRKEIR